MITRQMPKIIMPKKIISVCKMGAWRQDGVCSLCEIGTYKNFTGDAECLMCPVNKTTMETGSTECGKGSSNILERKHHLQMGS